MTPLVVDIILQMDSLFDPSQFEFENFGNGYRYTYTTTGGEGFSDFSICFW